MTIALVNQGTAADNSGTSSLDVTIPSTTAGNLLVMCVGTKDAVDNISSITGGGTWAKAKDAGTAGAASQARAGGQPVAFSDAAGLAAAPDAIATAGRHQLPVVLIDLGVGGAETPPTEAAVPDVTAGDEEQLTRALHRALAGRGPTVIRVRARPARGSPV